MRRISLAANVVAWCLYCVQPLQAQPRDRTAIDVSGGDAPIQIGGIPTDLEALLAYAERHAPAILVASTEVQLAGADAAAAAPLLPGNPNLQVGLGQRSATSGGQALDAQVQLMQPIEIGGQRRLRRDVATLSVATRERMLDRTRWSVHQQLHAGYRLAIAARERAAITRQLAEVSNQLLDVAQRRARTGDVSPLVVRIAEAEAAQARQRAVGALQDYRSACLSMAEIAGWAQETPPEPVGVLPLPRAAPGLQELLAIAMEHNRELVAMRSASAEAASRARLAAREALPNPAIGLQYGYEGATSAGGAQHIVMGILQLPITSFARNQEARARTNAEQHVVESQRDARASILLARIERLRTTVDASAARIAAFGDQVLPRFSENLSLVREAFELGEYDILRVSVALERFLAVQQQALDAYIDYFNAVAELELQIGQEIWSDEGNP